MKSFLYDLALEIIIENVGNSNNNTKLFLRFLGFILP